MLAPTYCFSNNLYRAALISLLPSLLTACGGGGGGNDDETPPASPPPSTQTYSIGGAVTGLSVNNAVVLQNNGASALTISNAGEFTFTGAISQGTTYNVTVATQPSGKTCTVTYGSGTVGNAAVKNIAVNCTPSPGAIDVNSPNTLSATHKPTLVGVVIDSAVANLRYDGPATLDGATDAAGQFNFLTGELITFKIGDVALPAVTGKLVITLFNFAGSNDINNTTLVNIARFLQSLDSDGDPANGISIPEAAHTAATGQSVDFSSASFDAQAAPIIASAIPGRTLIDESTAIAHVQATLDNLPKQVPIAGAWTTGSGINMRAVILLENGWYYGSEVCNGQMGKERGTWAYSGSTLTLAVSDDANGSCGFNTGSYTATLSNNSLTLGGATWTDVSYSATSLSGLYALKGFINTENYLMTLLTDTQYISLELDDSDGQASGEIGTYTWGGNSNPSATFTPLISFGDSVPISSTYSIQRLDSFLLVDDGSVNSMEVAMRPTKVATSLPGFWYLNESGAIADTEFTFPLIFTPSGKAMYLGSHSSCPGLISPFGGEIGNYAWDKNTNAFSLQITGDSNGACGIAGDANGISSATVTGNLLTFSNGTGNDGVSIKPSTPTPAALSQSSTVGIWKQTSGSGALTLFIEQDGPNDVIIDAIDSDCSASGTDYRVEVMGVTLDVSNNVVAFISSYDTPGCGLPATLGSSYSVIGDTLTISGVGTFIRQ